MAAIGQTPGALKQDLLAHLHAHDAGARLRLDGCDGSSNGCGQDALVGGSAVRVGGGHVSILLHGVRAVEPFSPVGQAGRMSDFWQAASPRLRALLLLLPVIAAGAAGRFAVPGLAGDMIGGLLYAVLIWLVLVIVLPTAITRRLLLLAGICLALVCGIELLQLTGLPAALADVFPPARLVFGSTFVVSDLVVGAAGVGLAAGMHRVGLEPVVLRKA